ncbi:hypothetical protein RB195_014467 [Necator americanus]|uniref:Uncharacterized protein n=1 Tax=Necator americanus TaxID=51031 RepID=A0ABR1E0K7_NECAM
MQIITLYNAINPLSSNVRNRSNTTQVTSSTCPTSKIAKVLWIAAVLLSVISCIVGDTYATETALLFLDCLSSSVHTDRGNPRSQHFRRAIRRKKKHYATVKVYSLPNDAVQRSSAVLESISRRDLPSFLTILTENMNDLMQKNCQSPPFFKIAMQADVI